MSLAVALEHVLPGFHSAKYFKLSNANYVLTIYLWNNFHTFGNAFHTDAVLFSETFINQRVNFIFLGITIA